MRSAFSEKDRQQMAEMGITEYTAMEQLEIFERRLSPVQLQRPCTVGDGIRILNDSEVEKYSQTYSEAVQAGRTMKFIPASGAASRMFKLLLRFNSEFDQIHLSEIMNGAKDDSDYADFLKFAKGIRSYAFFGDLRELLNRKGFDIEERIRAGQFKEIVNAVVAEGGLNYAELPKGLIKFHKYNSEARTAFEEHLVEAAAYCKDKDGIARLHLTISPEHEEAVKSHIKMVRSKYERNGLQFEINYSFQKPSTNTIAVDMENKPFRLDDGTILFRPGGHGALLENLNELEGDIIFIKNIDNVVPDRLKEETYKCKRILGGILVKLQRTIFHYLNKLSNVPGAPQLIKEAGEFAGSKLSIRMPKHILNASLDEQKQFLIEKLNRPLRVGGMVRNEGEPGGGPFWIRQQDGAESLQVVEAAQVNKDDPDQEKVWQSATHFSPTDFVCGVRDFTGKPFDLVKFRDPDAAFITKKFQNGRELKALELPGLWNGSMAFWNTVFVEVPIITFNPVKTVLDLLRPNHQPEN